MDWFQRGNPPPVIAFPYAPDIELADEVTAVGDARSHMAALNASTCIAWSHAPVEFPASVRNNSFEVSLPYDSLQCYDRRSGKFVGLTDHIWRSAMIVGHAFTPEQSSYSCPNWINLRPFLKRPGIGNMIGSMIVRADGVNPEWTLAELEAAVRRSFQDGMKTKKYLVNFASLSQGHPLAPRASAFFDISNFGYYPMGESFVDFFLQQSSVARYTVRALSVGAGTTVEGGRRRHFFRYTYSQAVFAKKDTEKVFKGLLHSLQHFKANLKIKDAVKELRQLFDAWELND
jgi:hypothetical protein